MNNFKKDTLQYFNQYYEKYTVAILTKYVLNLPDYLYEEESIFLNIGNSLNFPTNIQFNEENFSITGSFNRVIHDIVIPYESLIGIYDFEMTEGIAFILKFIYDPSIAKKSKPELRVIN
jgi:stringent starvation protein B